MVFLPQKLWAMLVWKSLVPGEGCFHPQIQCFSWKWRMVKLESETASWAAWTSYLLLLFSHQVMSDCLQPMDCSMPGFHVPHCLPEFAQVHVHWIGDAIQPSHPLLSSSSAFDLSQDQGIFQWLFASGGQSFGAATSASVLPLSVQGWFPLRLTGLISLLSKRLSRVFSSTTVWKHQFFGTLTSLWPSSTTNQLAKKRGRGSYCRWGAWVWAPTTQHRRGRLCLKPESYLRQLLSPSMPNSESYWKTTETRKGRTEDSSPLGNKGLIPLVGSRISQPAEFLVEDGENVMWTGQWTNKEMGTIDSLMTKHRNNGGKCACVCVCVCVCARARTLVREHSHSATPWTVARQAPLFIGFSRQEYWSGLPFPILGDLPDPGIKLMSLVSPALAGRFLTPAPAGKPQ